ncbi:MAG: pyridoxal-phosphate dependent enzyme [Enterococcus lacertideformus]|uniref:threonine ammonia-lyase n=1 Tax=Enterococcus lacertideformus TaxID=2771493 RepID=A0A931AUF4_9ENTE|nr:pyridoxal-phosphate dependent enzyme [Enterococcus lacertideformus]
MIKDSLRLPLSIETIHAAKKTIKEYARTTPLVQSMFLSAFTDGQVFLKLENMQLTGSFKFRGAFNKIAQLTEEEKSKGVIAVSAGNHAQGVALTSKLLGIKSTIVMPETAPLAKVKATESYGAEVILQGKNFNEAKEYCEKLLEQTNVTYIPPYDDPHVMAGQGTVGLEILDYAWDVDTVIVPVGGGGLIAGVATALKTFNEQIQIIGVQAENIHGMTASYKEGKRLGHAISPTIADGCAVEYPGKLTFEVVKELVDDMITVTEEEIKVDQYVQGKKVIAVVSGGNVDLSKMSGVIGQFTLANELR